MPEKDPSSYGFITYILVSVLAAWGGIVNWIRKRKSGDTRPFNFTELIGEIITSAFAGVLTFWLCEWSGVPPLLTAAMIGISGHMGSRAIFQMEKWAESKLKSQDNS